MFLQTRVTHNLPPRVVTQGVIDTGGEGGLDMVALLHLFDQSRSCGRHCVGKIKVPLLPKARQQRSVVSGTDDIVFDSPFDLDEDLDLNSKDGPWRGGASSLSASLRASAAAHVDGWREGEEIWKCLQQPVSRRKGGKYLSCQQQPVLRQRRKINDSAVRDGVSDVQRVHQRPSLYQPATALGSFQPHVGMIGDFQSSSKRAMSGGKSVGRPDRAASNGSRHLPDTTMAAARPTCDIDESA